MSFTKSTALILTLVAVLVGCAQLKTTTRFYTLNNPTQNQAITVSKTTPIAIEVLPVSVPERLKRPQLVLTSKDISQLKILEQDRWSSSFNDELHDAFVSGITNQLGAIDASRGVRNHQPTYRIAIVLQQFNAMPGEQVQTNFAWTITRLSTGSSTTDNTTLTCQINSSKSVSNDIDAVVKGLREAVAEATQAISANVSSLNNGEAGKCL